MSRAVSESAGKCVCVDGCILFAKRKRFRDRLAVIGGVGEG